jgi:DNA repair exonuclease SbcCD ATPase subunit
MPLNVPTKLLKTPKAGRANKVERAAQEAEEAVQFYQEEVDRLHEMKSDWEKRFPEAAREQTEIQEQVDRVYSAISTAKAKVAQAKRTIGPFKCQIKHAAAHYDGKAIPALLQEGEEGAELLQALLVEDFIEALVLSKDAIGWLASHPGYAEVISKAWIERAEMTPAITVPKL